jgi:hypothetical protein
MGECHFLQRPRFDSCSLLPGTPGRRAGDEGLGGRVYILGIERFHPLTPLP